VKVIGEEEEEETLVSMMSPDETARGSSLSFAVIWNGSLT
jgi:hypothetical protein